MHERNVPYNPYLSSCVYQNRRLLQATVVDYTNTYIRDDGLAFHKDGKGWLVELSIPDIATMLQAESNADAQANLTATVTHNRLSYLHAAKNILRSHRWSLTNAYYQPTLTFNLPFSRTGYPGPATTEHTATIAHLTTYDELDQALQTNAHPLHVWSRKAYEATKALFHHRTDSSANIRRLATAIGRWRVMDEVSPAQRIVLEVVLRASNYVGKTAYDNDLPIIYTNYIRTIRPHHDTQLRSFLAHELELDKHNRRAVQETLDNPFRFFLTTQPVGHLLYNLDEYVNVTSPLRRFHDVLNVLQWDAFVRGEPDRFTPEFLQKMTAQMNKYYQSLPEKEQTQSVLK